PRLLESEWCKREIDTFIELHGRNRIFTVLVEGEPKDSFPQQLLYEQVEELDEVGNIVIKKKAIEPLAADVRGKNLQEVKKKIKQERLRILAPMFGLGYDDLKQRHKERVMKQTMAISAGIVATLLGFSTISTVMALEIKEQSNKISEQNSKILEQNQEISRKAAEINQQSKQIQKQYEEAQRNYSQSLADASDRILKLGNRMAAIYIARSGLPSNLENPEKPYTPECEYALTDAMYLYHTEDTFLPFYVYPADGAIRSMKVSENGTYMIITDSTSQIYLWETKTNQLLYQIQGKNGMDCRMVNFFGKDKIIYDTEEGICIYNFMSKQVTRLDEEITKVIPYPDGKHYIAISLDTVYCYSIEDASPCFQVMDSSMWLVDPEEVGFTEDGSRIIFLNTNVSDSELVIIDANDGKILYSKIIPADFASCCYQNGKVLVNAFIKKKTNNYDLNMICVDTTECNVLWEKKIDNLWTKGCHYIQQEKNEYYYLYNANRMMTYDAKTGDLICSNEYSKYIVDSYPLQTGNMEVVLCEDGTMLLYNITTGETTDISRKIDYINYKISDYIWTPGHIYIQPKGGNQVIQYMVPNSTKTKIAELSEEDSYCQINCDHSLLLNHYIVGTERFICLKDIMTGDIKVKIPDTTDNPNLKYFFVGDGLEQFAVIQDKCNIYSTKDGKLLRSIEIKNGKYLSYDVQWSSDGRLLFVQEEGENRRNIAISTETGEVVMQMPLTEQEDSITSIYSNDWSCFACYGKAKDELRLYHPGEEQPYITKKLSLVDTQKVLFTDDGKYLCIVMNNGNASFYDTKTMELYKTLYEENIFDPERIQYIDSLHRYVIEVSGGAYLMDEGFNYVASIPKFLGLDVERQTVTIKAKLEIDTIPYYSFNTLIKEADKLLDGYTMSEELKRKYNVE
ncbi:MAG: hypothetical protein PUC65_15670, partial [Clostridiales bacterium]|nr:hypothetical protein [Clostridiales bacterium]